MFEKTHNAFEPTGYQLWLESVVLPTRAEQTCCARHKVALAVEEITLEGSVRGSYFQKYGASQLALVVEEVPVEGAPTRRLEVADGAHVRVVGHMTRAVHHEHGQVSERQRALSLVELKTEMYRMFRTSGNNVCGSAPTGLWSQ